jgi:hypothetical protein
MTVWMTRYLVNGNILAARAFISAFVSSVLAARPSLSSANASNPITVARAGETTDDITVTTDPILNWAQLAVQTCQRAQGTENKAIRESWIRLCGTYQSRGGLLAQPAVRQVCTRAPWTSHAPLTARSQVLQELSTLYFGLPPPRQAAANPFGDMFSALLGGGGGGGAQPAPRRLAPPATSALD